MLPGGILFPKGSLGIPAGRVPSRWPTQPSPRQLRLLSPLYTCLILSRNAFRKDTFFCKIYLPFCKKGQDGGSGFFGLYCVQLPCYTSDSRVDSRLRQGRCLRELFLGFSPKFHARQGMARMPFMKRISRKWLLALLPSFLHIAAAPARLGAG